MNILFVASELSPLAKTGGLGDVVGALPQAIRDQGHDARVIIPLYKRIKEQYSDQLESVRWSMIKLGWRTMYSGLYTMTFDGVPIYFIDNEYYFGHDSLYLDYSFDIERYSFFQRAVLEAMGEPMGFEPDILHLHDWQAGMIPVLLEAHYKPHGYHRDVHAVFTIHNLKFQGIHGRERIQDLLELPDRYMSESAVLKDGVPNFMKSGITYSNRVTTVSPTYASEIMMDYYGEGLNGLLGAQRWKLSGILDGIDIKANDPETDPHIAKNYTIKDWKAGKSACKAALQAELGLTVDATVPLAGMITRLTAQKGIDLLLYVLDEILDSGIQVVVLGTGEKNYEDGLKAIAARHPTEMAAVIDFDANLAKRIYAGADLYLMPSLFEPCGLAQMVAMRYGTLPVVRETGGLKDTVIPYNKYEGTGNGFTFANINAHELLFTTKNAAEVYRNEPKNWEKLVKTAMSGDYSWKKSAAEYIKLYEEILEEVKK